MVCTNSRSFEGVGDVADGAMEEEEEEVGAVVVVVVVVAIGRGGTEGVWVLVLVRALIERSAVVR